MCGTFLLFLTGFVLLALSFVEKVIVTKIVGVIRIIGHVTSCKLNLWKWSCVYGAWIQTLLGVANLGKQ